MYFNDKCHHETTLTEVQNEINKYKINLIPLIAFVAITYII